MCIHACTWSHSQRHADRITHTQRQKHTYTQTKTHTHMHVHEHTLTKTGRQKHTHTETNTHTHTHACTWTYTHKDRQTETHTHTIPQVHRPPTGSQHQSSTKLREYHRELKKQQSAQKQFKRSKMKQLTPGIPPTENMSGAGGATNKSGLKVNFFSNNGWTG